MIAWHPEVVLGVPLATEEPAWKVLGVGSRRGREGSLLCLYVTYMAGQVLLVLGMRQGQGAGWQDVAGGFHFIPGLLVQVLEGQEVLCE